MNYLLKDQVEDLVVLEELDQLQYARVAGAVVERLHLAEHSRPRVARNLLDDLHRVLEIRVDVHTRLHRGVGTLAQNLTSQLVQFCGKTGRRRKLTVKTSESPN